MRCSDSERSDAILGRPMVRNPLQRLPRKLTPVRHAMMTIIRPSFKPPSSKSIGTCIELTESDLVSARGNTGPDTKREFGGGEGLRDSVLLVETSSMADNRSDITKSVIVQFLYMRGNEAENDDFKHETSCQEAGFS
jgi:hypothetical protein